MRQLFILGAVLLLPVLAVAQATVIQGHASNWIPPYSVYAAPFVPLVTTPSLALSRGLPTQVGASNATEGNVAGATNATISIVSSNLMPTQVQPQAYVSMVTSEPAEPGAEAEAEDQSPKPSGEFEFGVAAFQSSQGVAQLLTHAKAHQQAARTYTNDDVARLNQNLGIVRYRGKTEQME